MNTEQKLNSSTSPAIVGNAVLSVAEIYKIMKVPITIADKYQEFFNFMNQEHNLILTIDEMTEIVSEVEKLKEKLIEDEEDYLTQKEIENTERNMNLISAFAEHFHMETGNEIKESVILSFFNA